MGMAHEQAGQPHLVAQAPVHEELRYRDGDDGGVFGPAVNLPVKDRRQNASVVLHVVLQRP